MSNSNLLLSKDASQLSTVPCDHCGLPAPARDDALPTFCCSGCRGAYDLIRGWGLEEFYELRDATGGEVTELTSSAYRDLDDPRLLGRSAPQPIDAAMGQCLVRSTLAISGLHCAACAWLIERLPERVDGWHSAQVNMHARTIEAVYDPVAVRLSSLAQNLHRVGYSISPLSDQATADEPNRESRDLLINVAFAGFCAANAMWIAIALYAGQFTGMASAHEQFLRFAGVVLGGIAVVFPGRVFFRSAWASVATRTPHMDLPVALGLIAGLAASIYALFDLRQDVYFDSIACLVFFLLTGRWLQMRQQRTAGEAVSELVRMAPPIATLVGAGESTRVPVTELHPGDRVTVAPGESVPVDGEVLKGQSLVDRSLLTGESCPVEIGVGGMVEAGTDNLQSELTVRVTAAGPDTKLSAMTEAVADAAQQRTPIVQLANRIGGWFVVVVVVLAALTGVAWWMIDASRALGNVVSLLIVACPCALALATPLAIAVSIGRLARRGVLVRSGDCLERLSRAGTIFFDKTGTLTRGRMTVQDWFGDRAVLADVASLEATVQHPIAHAILAYAEENRVWDPARIPDDVQHRVGWGVIGRVDGTEYRIGSPRLIDDQVRVTDELRSSIERVMESGASPVVVIRDQRCEAVLGVSDPLRDEAVSVVETLHSQGWSVRVLSGDHQPTVDAVAKMLGIDVGSAQGGLLPDQKLSAISEASGKGPVLMVGDGVNDAAALAAADVGIAIRGGARASLAAAPVVVRNGTLRGVLDLTQSARRTRYTIGRNFAISIAYNVVAVALAISGWITPLIAAALMPASSLTVLGLTLASPRSDQGTTTGQLES